MLLPKEPHPVDRHVGNRIRMRRIMLEMSQSNLGEALGVAFQQVQKYEKGTNRVGASRLQQLTEVLQVPVSFFFEGCAMNVVNEGLDAASSTAYVTGFLATNEGLALSRAFMQIADRKLRRKIIEMLDLIASAISQPSK